MSKINVFRIISDHFATLRDYRTGKTSAMDIVLFVLLPLFAAVITWWTGFNFDSSVLNGMLSAFAIFAGLLLNLLVLLCGFAGNPRFIGTDPATVTRRRLVREMHDNLSFSILMAIAVVGLALAGMCAIKYGKTATFTPDTNPIMSALLTIILVNFVLTLLMILKRIHVLLSAEFERPSLRKTA
jgi:hypothetical protein